MLMWMSYNDEYEIVRWRLIRHDEGKRPRKFRTMPIKMKVGGTALVLFLILFLAASLLDSYMYYLLPLLGVYALFFAVVAILKWRRNNKELDIALLLGIIVIIAITLITWSTLTRNAELKSIIHEIEMRNELTKNQ